MTRHEQSEINPVYPNSELSIDQKRIWAQNYGISTTVEGLILPDSNTALLDRKIVISIAEGRQRIEAAREQSKYILYLPGSYDLAHIGHLSYVLQATDYSLNEIRMSSPAINRKDLFIVSLIDSDALIQHQKLHKHISNGGDEEFFRPVEHGFDENGRHPRIDAVATLPVDCVGFLPAPVDDVQLLPPVNPLHVEAAIEVIRNLPISKTALDSVTSALQNFEQLKYHIEKNSLDFSDWWSIELWQLYLTLAIGKEQEITHDEIPVPFTSGQITRIISADDFKYFDQVFAISTLSGIAVEKLVDVHAQSTTQLVHEYDPQQLLKSKTNAIFARKS